MRSCIQIAIPFFLLLFCHVTAKEPSTAWLASMIVKTAEKYHYAPRPVNNVFSEMVYTSFLRMLDHGGTFFATDQITQLDRYKLTLDEQITGQKTTFLDTVTALYFKQLQSTDSLLRQFKNCDIDLSVQDTLWIDEDTVIYNSKPGQMQKKWEQWIKYMILWSYETQKDSDDKAVLQTPEKNRSIFNDVITRELCKIASISNTTDGIKEFTGSMYLKVIASAFDPHTEYMSSGERNLF